MQKKVFDFSTLIEINGNSLVSQAELKELLVNKNQNNKAFWMYNPLKLSQQLEKHPLVQQAKIRSLILPQKKLRIFIKEEIPWSFYRGKVLNLDGDVIIESQYEDNSESISKLYQSNNKLINISSKSNLNNKDIAKLKAISKHINDNLALIDSQALSKLAIDEENNLTACSPEFKFLIGNYKEEYKTKLKKLEQVLNKISANKKIIDYIDLSLTTNEVIIGKIDL